MFKVHITERGVGSSQTLEFDKSEITLGRADDCDVVLPKGNITKAHSRIVCKDGRLVLVDLRSTNGTFVNGKRLTVPQVVHASDEISIGDFTLTLEGEPEEPANPAGR